MSKRKRHSREGRPAARPTLAPPPAEPSQRPSSFLSRLLSSKSAGALLREKIMDFVNQPRFGNPQRPRPLLAATNAPPPPNQSVMQVAAPIKDAEGVIRGILVLMINPDAEFSRILSVARSGASGETFAFDAEGVRSSNVVVIEKGVLKQYVCDSYSARRLNLKPTGILGVMSLVFPCR